MPKEAARIFLRVTDVRAERLNDARPSSLLNEGAESVDDFIRIWESTMKPTDRAVYGWRADPWVWVIEFERITEEEAWKEVDRNFYRLAKTQMLDFSEEQMTLWEVANEL